MHVSLVRYTKKFNLGDYQNEDIGCELTVQAGEPVEAALHLATTFVEEHHARLEADRAEAAQRRREEAAARRAAEQQADAARRAQAAAHVFTLDPEAF